MEQFTLLAAQTGKPLITRDGRPARYVAIMQQSDPQFPLVVEVFQYTESEAKEKWEDTNSPALFPAFYSRLLADESNWHMENYSETGEFLPPFEQPEDLFIQTL